MLINTEKSTNGVRLANMPFKTVLLGDVVQKARDITDTYGKVACEVVFANFIKRGFWDEQREAD